MIEDRDQTLITTPNWEFKFEFGKGLLAKKELKLAEKMLLEALEMAIKKYGEDDLRLARIHGALADLYYEDDRLEASEISYQKVLELCETNIGPNHKVLAKTLEKYSNLLKKMKRTDDADKMHQRSRVISRKIESHTKIRGHKLDKND